MFKNIEIKTKKLIFRSILLATLIIMYVIDKSLIIEIANLGFWEIKVYHLLWLFLMMEMIVVMFPKYNKYVSCGKLFTKHFEAAKEYDKSKFKEEVKKNNISALITLGIWILLLGGIGLIYMKGVIDRIMLYIISFFFYFSDQFCINVWCPFRKLIMKNKCCTTCRIFNWGHFMIFSPLIFIPGFYTYSLVLVSLAIIIQWEIHLKKHPERFNELSNLKLRCVNCTEECTRN